MTQEKKPLMKRGFSQSVMLVAIFAGITLATTLFNNGGGSALTNSSFPADKAAAVEAMLQIEKNGLKYHENKGTFVNMYVTSPLEEGYLETDAWTERLFQTDDTVYDKDTDTPAVTDYFKHTRSTEKGVKFTTTGTANYFSIFVDSSNYSTNAKIVDQMEAYLYEKAVARYGLNRVKGDATALSTTEITSANKADKNSDGKFMITVIKKI